MAERRRSRARLTRIWRGLARAGPPPGSAEGVRSTRRGTRELGAEAQPYGGPAERSLLRWLGPAVVGVTFAALAAWSWRKWADVQIDFGNQLYLPWQLTLGKALYRDIDYKEGPLSIYTNAALFELFGTSLRTLIWANLVQFAGLTGLIYALFARACGRFTATVCCLVMLIVFGFSQYGSLGNYNYVLPYTQEQTHGLILGVATIACLSRYVARHKTRWALAAGVLLGLVFLTKVELFVPAAAAAIVGMMLGGLRSKAGVARGARATAMLVAGTLLPLAVCFALLARGMPAELAARGVAGNWAHLDAGILDDPFYRWVLGLDDVAGNLRSTAVVSAAVVAIAATAIAVDRLLARAKDVARLGAPVLALAATWALIAASDAIPWHLVGYALPAATALGAIAALAFAFHARSAAVIARFASLAMWAVYAFALLGKILLNPRIWHYGFTLAMPGALLLVAGLLWLVPAFLRERGGAGLFAQAVVLGPIVACTGAFFAASNRMYEQKVFAVGPPTDRFFAQNSGYDRRSAIIATATEQLRGLMPPDATLLVLPEGTIMNYWLRRSNPTRYTLFTPSAIAFAGGEPKMLENLQAHPPDFIALVHRETSEFGVGYFGADPLYGRLISDWVRRDYTRVGQVGAEPFRDHRFGVALLRRQATLGPSGAAELR